MRLERKKDEQNTFNELDRFINQPQKTFILADGGTPPVELGRVGDLAENGTSVYVKQNDGTWRAI